MGRLIALFWIAFKLSAANSNVDDITGAIRQNNPDKLHQLAHSPETVNVADGL